MSAELSQHSSLQGGFSCSNKEFHRSCVYFRCGEWDTLPLQSRYVLIHENWSISSSTSREYFLINFKPKGSHCKLQNYIYLLPYKNCGIPYIAESITPVDRRINIQGKKVAKLLLLIIWIFAKMQHFKFYSLRWLSIIWMFAKMQHFKFYSLRWYQEMIMKMK